jgi:chromosome segregation ATPase
MLAGIIFRIERALGKERLRNERDAARYERNEHLRERDEYHRQLDIALGERNECRRQLDIALGECNECRARLEEIERERTRHRSYDLVSALANALASMTVQRDDLRRERDEIKRELASLTSRVIDPDAPSQGDDVHDAKSL